jgi:hypothetical protein
VAGDCVALDAGGFVLTGTALREGEGGGGWPLAREPHFLETSRPCIVAVGDVRAGSVKRVAAAVGEGASAVQSLHQVLSHCLSKGKQIPLTATTAAPAAPPGRRTATSRARPH